MFSRGFNYYRTHGAVKTVLKIFEIIFRLMKTPKLKLSPPIYFHGRIDALDKTTPAREALSQSKLAIIGALDLPQCKKYRVLQKIEQLAIKSIDVEISSGQDMLRAFKILQTATSVLFYRLPKDEYFDLYVEEATRLGARIGYDIDDPLFSKEIYKQNKNLDCLSAKERNHLLSQTSLYQDAILKAEFVTTSTPGMVNELKQITNSPVYLWRNCLDSESLKIIKAINIGDDDASNSEIIIISYMSGSRAHDFDFKEVTNAIIKILEKNLNVRLYVTGFVQIPESLNGFDAQIKVFPFVGYEAYFSSLSYADIVIIPLAISQFNECKSAIRYLEAAALGKPCIISRVGDFKSIVEHGKDGYLVSSEMEWVNVLQLLVDSKNTRANIGENAIKKVMDNHTSYKVANDLPSELINHIRGN